MLFVFYFVFVFSLLVSIFFSYSCSIVRFRYPVFTASFLALEYYFCDGLERINSFDIDLLLLLVSLGVNTLLSFQLNTKVHKRYLLIFLFMIDVHCTGCFTIFWLFCPAQTTGCITCSSVSFEVKSFCGYKAKVHVICSIFNLFIN